jgi:hypothetical protein
MMQYTYTSEFAQNIWLPFSGFKAALLINNDSTEQDFLNNKDQWFSEQGIKYSRAEMSHQWKVLVIQKTRIEELYKKTFNL